MRPGLGSKGSGTQLGIFWGGLKNQVLPPDTGKGVLKESGPAKTLFFSELVVLIL